MKSHSLIALSAFVQLVFAQNVMASSNLSDLADQLAGVRERSSSYEEFHESKFGVDYTVDKVLNKIKETGAPNVCTEFASLKTESLLELNDVIQHMNPTALPCHAALNQKIELHYEAVSALMDQGLSLRKDIVNRKTTQVIYISDRNGGISVPESQSVPQGVVALTFDDGPHGTYTDKILDVLQEEGVLATFFVLGDQAKRYPEVLRRVGGQNHAVGTHTKSHKDLTKQSFEGGKKEINDGFELAYSALGYIDPFFRFPYGARTRALRSYLRDSRISDFLWNVDSEDWKYKDPDTVVRNVMKQVSARGNGVILMHDIQGSTKAALRPLIRKLKDQGYSFAVFKAEKG